MGKFFKKIWAAIKNLFAKNNILKTVLLLLLIHILLTIGTWAFFIINGSLPLGEDLSKADWLAFISGIYSLFGTLFLGIVAYKQNVSLHKANESLERVSLNLTIQDLKMNGFSEVYFKFFVINSELNAYFLDKGKFRPKQIKFTKCEIQIDDKQRIAFPFQNEKINAVYSNSKDSDGYFPCNLNGINPLISSHIASMKTSSFSNKDLSPENKFVLWMEYELSNSLGVCSKFSGKIVADRTDEIGFINKVNFITLEDIIVTINNEVSQ